MPPRIPQPTPSLTFPDSKAWTNWITQNATTSPGIWLTLARKGQTDPTSLTMDQALEAALCHGWINGQGRTNPDGTRAQRFTPRSKHSVWSKRNVGIVERLEAQGRLAPAGLHAVEAARRDGRWERAYGGSGVVEEAPKDLSEAVQAAGTDVWDRWLGMKKGERYAVYVALAGLRTAKGREKRIQGVVDLLKAKAGSGRVEKRTGPAVGRQGLTATKTTATTATTTITTTRSGRTVKKPLS